MNAYLNHAEYPDDGHEQGHYVIIPHETLPDSVRRLFFYRSQHLRDYTKSKEVLNSQDLKEESYKASIKFKVAK